MKNYIDEKLNYGKVIKTTLYCAISTALSWGTRSCFILKSTPGYCKLRVQCHQRFFYIMVLRRHIKFTSHLCSCSCLCSCLFSCLCSCLFLYLCSTHAYAHDAYAHVYAHALLMFMRMLMLYSCL